MGFLSLFGCSKSKQPVQPSVAPNPSAAKTIVYRGGIVQFDLPSNWREEYKPEGGGTFYEDRPNAGTLRLNVLTLQPKSGEPPEQAIERAYPAKSCEVLPSGLHMRHEIADAEEKGTSIRLHSWVVAVPVPPTRFRVACFTYTILARQASDPAIVAELALVDKSIRSAEYSREPGVIGAFTK